MAFRNAPERVVKLCLLSALIAPASGFAADCETISNGHPIIYGAGGSAQRDLVGKAGVVLENGSNPIYVVYKDDAGACSGINALTGLGPTTITGNAVYWDAATGVKTTCTLPLAGATVDFAVMGNGPLLCPLVTDESVLENITELTGPISTVNVIVPNASTQQAISAEAFYLIYGLGPEADIAPWNNADPAYYVRRDENSFVQIALGKATGLPVTSFYGTDAGTNANSVALLTALATPEQGIAFVSGDVADANRATVRTLAWQDFDQNAAYWPDSEVTAFDKRNVRDGQYALWNPIHFYGFEGSTEGSFQDANVRVLIEYLADKSQPAGTTKTVLDTAIDNKNIPICAMEVQRDGDLGPIYAYAPPEPCGCYFDFRATGATECAVCDDSNPCADGTCRNGYCEAY